MGSDVPIMRRRVWLDDGNDITLEEWKAYVATDPDMRPHPRTRCASATGSEGHCAGTGF